MMCCAFTVRSSSDGNEDRIAEPNAMLDFLQRLLIVPISQVKLKEQGILYKSTLYRCFPSFPSSAVFYLSIYFQLQYWI